MSWERIYKDLYPIESPARRSSLGFWYLNQYLAYVFGVGIDGS